MPVKSKGPTPRALIRLVQVNLPCPRAATAPEYPNTAVGSTRNPAPQKVAFQEELLAPERALTPIRMSWPPADPPNTVLPVADRYSVRLPLSNCAFDAAPNEAVPVPSAFMVKVAPATCWVVGRP